MLDADVLHALPLRDTLLTLAFPPFEVFVPCWSAAILAEVERSLARRIGESRAKKVVRALQEAFPDATAEASPGLSRRMPNHPQDRHVLALALATTARVIVTSNVRHFAGAAELGVDVQHPDAFLCNLFDLDPRVVRAAIERQLARLRRPPLTHGEFLARLTRSGLSGFARRLEE